MWLIIFLFIVAGTSAQIVGQDGDKCSRHYVCPPQYLRLSQNCYFFSKNKTTWQDAFYSCQDLHGKFAIIRNGHQDKMLRNFLNKISIVSEDRWIGGMYDWEQMVWKWGASGRQLRYKGFSRMEPEDKEKLKWHCIVLDPNLQYKWNTRSCLEEKYFICQTKLRKVAQKERKKLQQQYRSNKFNKLNEVLIPDAGGNEQIVGNLKDNIPNGKTLPDSDNNLIKNTAFGTRDNSVIEKRRRGGKNKRNQKNKKKDCDDQPHIIRNGTAYNAPQLKYGPRRRRNKSKEEKDKDASIEKIQTQIYYSGPPQSPLHPRVITEELSFR